MNYGQLISDELVKHGFKCRTTTPYQNQCHYLFYIELKISGIDVLDFIKVSNNQVCVYGYKRDNVYININDPDLIKKIIDILRHPRCIVGLASISYNLD